MLQFLCILLIILKKYNVYTWWLEIFIFHVFFEISFLSLLAVSLRNSYTVWFIDDDDDDDDDDGDDDDFFFLFCSQVITLEHKDREYLTIFGRNRPYCIDCHFLL